MILKRVTLSGFKSFADRVDFNFGRGITCIVGPNGCGKSNVLDAFKWVLGEQSAKSLRGKHMSDMIFNGSSTRKSSGVAQVELVFGNDDRALPIDRDEIIVSRKLYRSGESEYLLNQDPSRLKDIRELFLDTGIGVDAYSVIEQGRVDALLQSSASDRRIIFEEAAGISRYKARKKEAQRKLERTEQNLLRVEDIIDELEKRLRSVKLQAGKARNYREYEARLNELRSTFVMAEYHRFTVNVVQKRKDSEGFSDAITGLKTRLDRLEADEAKAKVALDELSSTIAETDNKLVQTRSELTAHEERIESARHRIEEQKSLAERTRQRAATDDERLQNAGSEVERVQNTVTELKEQSDLHHAHIAELNDSETGLNRNLAEVQASLEEEKAAILDVLRRSGQAHNEIVRLNSHRESLIDQKGRLSKRNAQINEELAQHLDASDHSRNELQQVEEHLHGLETDLENSKHEAAQIDSERQELVDGVASRKERRSALFSRRDLLLDLEKKREGVGEGVREWLELAAQAVDSQAATTQAEDSYAEQTRPEQTREPLKLVADLFETDIEFAPVIEVALGSRDQCLVAASHEEFYKFRSQLPDPTGRISVYCLDRLPPVLNERDFSDHDGFVARAIDLVRVPAAYERVARHLLAKTIVVTNLDQAAALAASDMAGHRFITRQGEIVDADGSIGIGPATNAAGVISRRSELREIEAEIQRVEGDLRSLDERLGATRARAGDLERQQQELRTKVYEANTAKVETRAAIEKFSETIERLRGEQPLIAREVAMIDRQVEEVLTRTDEASQSVDALETENEQREAKSREFQDQIATLLEQRHELQKTLTETKVAAGQVAEKRATAAQSLNTLNRTIAELEHAVASANEELQQCFAKIDDAERSIISGQETIRELTHRLAALETESASLRRTRDDLRDQESARVEQIRELREDQAARENDLHQCEMAVAEINVRMEELIARVREELNIELPENYTEYEHQEHDWEGIENEIEELRAKMTRLGNVNLGAIEELAELEERHGFLTRQHEDLTASRRELEQLIDRLDGESRERFDEAFKMIRENFRALFRKLFGGGRADVVLEDPENTLESGIEIVAQPPGKELQVISLMSGGEKSMTAIALLMSIFKCRPSPFVFLDEVDAALDEANNERFNLIVNEFNDRSQFIVITHSKRTMSIAEQLYGITMQEPGISTRVAVQINDANVA